MRVELETILPIQSIVVATGKLFVYGLMETLNKYRNLKASHIWFRLKV